MKTPTLFRTANSAAAVVEMPPELALDCVATANALPEQLADGWHVLAPFGEFPEPAGRYVQVFGAEQAATMVRSWNSIGGKAFRWMKNVRHRLGAKLSMPIFDAPPGAAHPDLDPTDWSKLPLVGEVTELRATANALEGKVVWSDAARRGDRERGPLHPSINWWHNQPDAQGRVYPEHVESITLTRTPNIRTVPAWTANSFNPDEIRDEHGQWASAPEVGKPESYKHFVRAGKDLPESHPLKHGNRKAWAQKALGIKSADEMSDAELEGAATVGRTLPSHASTTQHLREISDERTKRTFDARTGNTTLAGIPLAHNQTANTDPMNQEQLNALRKSLGLPETADPAACITAATTANAALATLAERDAALNTANTTVTTLNTERDTLRTQHGAITTERDTLQTANTAFAAEVATLRKGLLDLAQERGAITPAERESFETRLSTANTIADALKELPARKAMNTQHVELNGTRHDLSTANARMDALEAAVKTRMDADKCDRDTAYGRVKADKNFAGLFAAMQDPAKAKA